MSGIESTNAATDLRIRMYRSGVQEFYLEGTDVVLARTKDGHWEGVLPQDPKFTGSLYSSWPTSGGELDTIPMKWRCPRETYLMWHDRMKHVLPPEEVLRLRKPS